MEISKEMMEKWAERFNQKYAKPKPTVKQEEPKPKVAEPKPVPVAKSVKAKAKPKKKEPVATKKARAKRKVEPKKPVPVEEDPKEVKAVQDVIKSIQKTVESHSQNLAMVHDYDGEKVSCDGYRMIVTTLKGIAKESDEEGRFQYKKVFPETYEEELESPDAKELKALWKAEKEKYKLAHNGKGTSRPPMYVFENGYALNIKYLIDGITATGTTKFKYAGRLKPCLFESESGNVKYLCCPINNTDKTAGCYYVA